MKIDLNMNHGHADMPEMREYDYPSMTYRGPEDLELPEEGVMKIRYRKTRSSESTMGDHTMYECTIEAREILSVKGEKAEAEEDMPAKSRDEASGALDKLMEVKMRSKKY